MVVILMEYIKVSIRGTMNILIKMRTTAAGPSGTYMAGSTVLIDEEKAKQFISGGYADKVETKKPAEPEKKIVEKEPERAVKGPKEKATLSRKLEK